MTISEAGEVGMDTKEDLAGESQRWGVIQKVE